VTVLSLPSPPLPGSFGLTKIEGLTGRFVSAMQGAGGHGSPYTHAFLVLDNGEVIEAQPGRAVIRPLADYLERQAADPEDVVFCDAPIRRRLADYGGGDPDGYLESVLRRMVVAAGRSMEGTPYSFVDYLSLALLHTIGDERRPEWLTDYVADSGHLICSALLDRAYELVGIEVFDDGRAHGDVMPADLDEYRVKALEEFAARSAA
jgi:hypothetical protein